MTMRFTILGCGSSGGVPRVGSGWGACDPANPRNRRRRCSMLVEKLAQRAATRVLVDTTPDCREQLLDADVNHLDAVLYTHDHADHTHGIDDVRPLVIHMRRVLPVFMDETTAHLMKQRFGYCFSSPEGSGYPPIVREFRITPGHAVKVDGAAGELAATPIPVHHGPNYDALGFRFGDVAYTPDVNAIPDASVPLLEGLDLWIIDALRHTPHPTHFSLGEALDWIARMKPKRAVVTNLHTDLDYEALRRDLPANVEPAYDGMVLDA
ncbi:phosphoribosyl 1,2-cyclic phosphodiesterase [Alsobacter metallidurans]|uniref:Phosphoribosyl 1,2-cyclic phosphodiesterase n=1 Tax=Alsobacter metallidurans TaxID=340221 RepID=A0A917MHG3_9HYPH|nr:MBL fold metallo-hydrolase [Alsobacter metallidurans]GGH20465.1 phosphoribosyl 1,2-cyclic phosphodiesterase [Alsobacter metallidurans]